MTAEDVAEAAEAAERVSCPWCKSEAGQPCTRPQAAAAGRDAIRQLAELQAENERLTRWKTEATKVLKGWDALWDELDRHGQLGDAPSPSPPKCS